MISGVYLLGSMTSKVRVTEGAACHSLLPLWTALTLTIPSSPVNVKILPSNVAGPSINSKSTSNPDVAVAFNSIGSANINWSEIIGNSINCDAKPAGIWRTNKLS